MTTLNLSMTRGDDAGLLASGAGIPDGVIGASSVPLFHQPWWLDAVAPGAWSAVEIESGGSVVARLPYVVRGPRRMRVLTQPPLTPFLGPWIAPIEKAKVPAEIGRQMNLLADLEAALPKAAAFRQAFSTAVMGVLPFVWAGYRAEVRYTYRLEDLTSEDGLWEGMSSRARSEIRKAQGRLEVRTDIGLDRLQAVWAKTFRRQGLPAPDHARLERIEEACTPRAARQALFAVDEYDRVHAAVYVVLGGDVAYYLVGGGDPVLRGSGAASLLLWTAILQMRSRCRVFDFEGSMIAPLEKFFRSFGGSQTPYLRLSRATTTAALALRTRETANRLRRRCS